MIMWTSLAPAHSFPTVKAGSDKRLRVSSAISHCSSCQYLASVAQKVDAKVIALADVAGSVNRFSDAILSKREPIFDK